MDADIRSADPDEAEYVIQLLDAALLAFDRNRVRAAIEQSNEDVFVAVSEDSIRGAIVLDGNVIEAIAVKPRYRRRGYGRALVEAAADARRQICATCDPRHRSFYEALGFSIREQSNGRLYCAREDP